MQWILVCCLIASLGAAPAASGPDPPLTQRQIVEAASPTVALIEVEGDGASRLGTGFVVASEGSIATNLHVLDGATKVTVVFPGGRRFEQAVVLAFDVEQDLAIIRVPIPDGEDKLASADLAKGGTVAPGDRVIVIGNPFGLELTVTDGIVSSWRDPQGDTVTGAAGSRDRWFLLPGRRLLQISASISPGSSGAPVLDERARVVGIAVSGVLYGLANLNFAVPVDEIRRLLRRDDPMDLRSFREGVARARLDLARPHFESARFAFEQDDAETADRQVERALMLFPSYDEALVLSGRIRLKEGDRDRARSRFLEAVAANDGNAEAWYRLGGLHHAEAVDRGSQSMMGRARSAYERCLALDEWHAGAAYALALLHMRVSDFESAEPLLLRAIESDQRMADAHAMLGEIYLQWSRIGEARKAFERAIWENPDHPRAYLGLARICMLHAGGQREAEGYLRRFLEISKGVESLRMERDFALRIAARYFPDLADR